MHNKGDNAAAIENYIKTIGHLEPSYVIRRFLDAHKIQYLTNYLQALHTDGKGLANEDHTILLLNCYTKLKNTKELDEFILKGKSCNSVNRKVLLEDMILKDQIIQDQIIQDQIMINLKIMF